MFHSPLREMRFVMRELLPGSGLERTYADRGYSAGLADDVLALGRTASRIRW